MKPKRTCRRHRGALSVVLVALFLTLATVLGFGNLAAADENEFDLPAGVACSGFDLRVKVVGGTQVNKEFVDKNGNVVRTISAGKGSALTFTNLKTGATLSLRPNGSVTRTTVNPDGTNTVATTGHTVIILFPTDIPAGPSTTLHVGRVVYTDSNGFFTLQEVSGRAIDICAALAK